MTLFSDEDGQDQNQYPRRKHNLSPADMEQIRNILNEKHPCSNFTGDQVHNIKEVVNLLTPENIQSVKDILEIFKEWKRTVSGTIKISMLFLLIFFLWLAYKTGFLGVKLLKP